MREYRIKKGHNSDISAIVEKYFNTKGDVFKGINFEVDGIGVIDMKQDKSILSVNIIPPKKVCNDYTIIKKWNDFLLEATGLSSKERKKDFGKISK